MLPWFHHECSRMQMQCFGDGVYLIIIRYGNEREIDHGLMNRKGGGVGWGGA